MYRTVCRAALVTSLVLASTILLAGPIIVEVGDGTIRGSAIEPYAYTWRQCMKKEGAWVDGGAMHERMTRVTEDGREYLRHEQDSQRPDGGGSASVTYFDAETLGPLRVEVKAHDAEGNSRGAARYALTPDGYSGSKTRGDQSKVVSGKLSSNMYHGMAFGLALAAVEKETELPIQMPASMLSFDASYRVIATSAGVEELVIGDRSVTAQLVDVEWHHIESGDVYPPGPDASGGRYWIVSNPPDGVPYVPRYQTDTYAVEITRDICPGP